MATTKENMHQPSQFKIISTRDFILNGRNAYEVNATANNNMFGMVLVEKDPNSTYCISFGSSKGGNDKSNFEMMINSFKIQ